MEQKKSSPTEVANSSSHYGYDLLNFLGDHQKYSGSAYDAATYILTHGGHYPLDRGLGALAAYDRAAFDVFERRPDLAVTQSPAPMSPYHLSLFVNTLGRLHIRPTDAGRPVYAADDRWLDLGYVDLDVAAWNEITTSAEAAAAAEAVAFAEVKLALEGLHAAGVLGDAVELAIDSIQHVESVCFFVGDRFFARIERYTNLLDTKGGKGFLPPLRDKPYSQWSADEVLIVGAIVALFRSGGCGRFEELNGTVLTASSIVQRLRQLQQVYEALGSVAQPEAAASLFQLADSIREQAAQATRQPWLRYRATYGLNFQKIERVLPSMRSSEAADLHVLEFGDDYRELVSRHFRRDVPQSLFFKQLATACLTHDLAGVPCDYGSPAVTGWVEYLIERIVASAVKATQADYGMSSSLRDYSVLVDRDEARLTKNIHALTQAQFFTCFVSRDFGSRFERSTADNIAISVQKRMMFNRWHFIPGNLARGAISAARHWYYPPTMPDIATHADMHRAAHGRAMVKFAIRAPGPDVSRYPLQIAGRPYRGVYDIRVVRMTGEEFSTEDMLRARRRTLWMEALYGVLVPYLEAEDTQPIIVKGFQTGSYLDLPTLPEDRLLDLDPALASALGAASEPERLALDGVGR